MDRSEIGGAGVITTLGITLIVILVAVEIGCFVMLRKIFREISAEKTDKRREFYRRRAYSALDTRTTQKENRQKLWRSIRK